MARKKQSTGHTASKDLVGFLILSATVFTALSLASYNMHDPSFHTQTPLGRTPIHNWGGLVGAYLADLLIQWWGYLSALVVLGGAYLAYAIPFNHIQTLERRHWVGLLLIVGGVCVGLGHIRGELHTMITWAGVSGDFAKRLLTTYLGPVGAVLAIPVFVFSGLFVCIAWSPRALGQKLVAWSQAGLETIQDMVLHAWKGVKHLDKPIETAPPSTGKSRSAKLKLLPKLNEDDVEDEDAEDTKDDEGTQAEVKELLPLREIPIRHREGPSKAEPVLPSFHAQETEMWKPKEATLYTLPSSELLQEPKVSDVSLDKDELLDRARILEEKLKDFGVMGRVVGVQPGPVVTMYEFEPAPGVKVNQVTRLNDDLALGLSALSVRITLMPGKSVLGIEVANPQREIVYFKDVVDDKSFGSGPSLLTLALGKDISGTPYTTDLRKMPHLLIAGATGSGKSVAINSIILSVLYKATPDQVRMILVDPKMLELNLYESIPHLLLPVVTDPKKASAALRWAVSEMERRYRLMADYGVRNIEGYNRKASSGEAPSPAQDHDQPELTQSPPLQHEGPMPYIMIVIDELADLMMVSSREVEDSIIRLAQMARASGIHLLLATQRPSVDVITGVIKANMPARISFQVSSKIDSRTILDTNGAESLLGAGDMLFLPPGGSKLLRVHGAFVSDTDVKKVTDFWKKQGKPQYKEEILQEAALEEALANSGDPDDDLYRQALQVVRASKVASISLIQRKLRIGYNRSARLVERMEEDGLLAPGEVGKPREVIMSRLGA